MNKKHLETLLYSAGGIVALIVILIAANFIISSLNLRADLTQGSVYTLSQGTRNILGKLEAPVTIRYYESQGSAMPVGPRMPNHTLMTITRKNSKIQSGSNRFRYGCFSSTRGGCLLIDAVI